LLKLNTNGIIQWVQKINSINYASPNDIFIDNNNNIFITGSYSDYSGGGDAIFVAKYNTSGTQVWYNNYGLGFYTKQAFGIGCDNIGNIIIAGRYMNTITLGAYTLNATNAILDMDGFISKLDVNGNVIWANKLTSPGQGTDELRSLAVDAANNIYTVGNVDSTAIIGNITIPLSPSSKAIIIKFDQDGNPLWAKASISGSQYNKQTIIKGNDNDMYFCGDFSSSLQIDSFAIVSTGSNDGFMIRFDDNGKIKWMKGFGGTQSESAQGLVKNSTNDLFVAGGFYGTASFGSTTLTSAGSEDIYLAKFKQCDPPIVNVTFNGNPVICPGESLTLLTEYCSTNTYQWLLNNIEIAGANNPTLIASAPGEYKVKVSSFADCETTSNPVILNAEGIYRFIGNGNWDIASNWQNNNIPPSTLPSCYEIIIDPQINGECILNVPQIISAGAKLTVKENKMFRIISDLTLD